MKKCPSCKVLLKRVYFSKNKTKRDGLSWWCKKCQAEYFTKYRNKDPQAYREKCRVKQKRWYWANPEKQRKRYRKYYENDKGKYWRLRFEVLQRDNFTCQYCGRKAPDVILQIDHYIPKSKGGKNEKNNYKTACIECNIGKGDMLLCVQEEKQ